MQADIDFLRQLYEPDGKPNTQYQVNGSPRSKYNSNAAGKGVNSTPKAIKMVKDSIRTVRKVSYSLVKEFAPDCPKSGKWMRRLAVLIKDVESSWKQCLKIAPNAQG